MHKLTASANLARFHGNRRIGISKWIVVFFLILTLKPLNNFIVLAFAKTATVRRIFKAFKSLKFNRGRRIILERILLLLLLRLRFHRKLFFLFTLAAAWWLVCRLPIVLSLSTSASLNFAKSWTGKWLCILVVSSLLRSRTGDIINANLGDMAQQNSLRVVVHILVQKLSLVTIKAKVL